ncbi:MAG: transposase [Bacteroidota bacterium]
MFLQRLKDSSDLGIRQRASHFLLHQLDKFTASLREDLDEQIDSRLVRTFYDLIAVILMFRHRQMGLLLSELGGWVCGFCHAPAGTKRISNLLRSPKWSSTIIDDFFWHRTKVRIEQLQAQGKRPLMLWDDSRIEKPESWVCEGLCSVWSSKAKRLTRIKKGYYNAISRICVPGFKWTGVFLSHLGGVPSVCQMSWWTTRGKYKEDPDNIIFRLLRKIHEQLSSAVVHVLDRGYASEKMLRYLFIHEQDFIIRWKKNHLLTHLKKGTKQTHLLARSFKGKAQRIVRDKMRKQHKSVSISWAAVFHPEFTDNQLFLVIIRDRKNYNGPMYILTSIALQNQAQAWEVMFSYMHRWEAEQSFRFLKSEMGIEAPRLWFWDNRMKLLGIVSIAYEFLLHLMRNWKIWAVPFMKTWCHRTGERYRNASIPLYRLRLAISNCLLMMWFQNSG